MAVVMQAERPAHEMAPLSPINLPPLHPFFFYRVFPHLVYPLHAMMQGHACSVRTSTWTRKTNAHAHQLIPDPALSILQPFFANIPRMQAEDERNRGKEGGGECSINGNGGGANGDDGGGPKGEAFQLSSRGRRGREGLEAQEGACCA